MPRYRVTVEYDGRGLVGWQRQDNGPSVQQAIEDAIFGFCGERTEVIGAGRTDAGVHASGQVAHFDLGPGRPPVTVMKAINYHLKPAAVVVLDCREVDAGFHARFSAIRRSYRYRILNRPAAPTLARGFVWHVIPTLDDRAMAEAAMRLVGRHDFSSFRAVRCQAASPVKTLDRLEVRRAGEEIVIETSARSFLHNQVRAMVGSLKLVGEGRWSPDDLGRALAARDRAAGGPTAPADGLCLTAVDYPDDAG